MFNNKRDVVAAVEIGTSKICVLVGEIGDDGGVDILGIGLAPSSGSVIKGEVENMEKAFTSLGKALDEADSASGGRLEDCSLINILVSGCGIESHQGLGTVFIKNESHKVTESDRTEAHENARIFQHSADCDIINSTESYCLIDDRRVRNPLNHTARKLDACVHVVHGVTSRLENFRSLLRESGFDDSLMELTFSPLASDAGILTDEERENGILLIDIGAGTTEYLVEFNSGILASGVLQVGFEHVYNDLSIGLELPFGVCRKLVEEGTLAKAAADKREYLEISSSTGRTRRIPLASFETIIDARLREIFEIIRLKLKEKNALSGIGNGGVLTGGGALCPRTEPAFREVFDMVCRIGQPIGLTGAVTGVDDPRFAAICGALKVASYYRSMDGAGKSRGTFGNMLDAVDSLFGNTVRTWKNLRGAFKI